MDRENALKEVWRVELLARLTALDKAISEQAQRTEFVRLKHWDATTFEKRSKLLQLTRQHYLQLLEQLLVDGECPMLWSELEPEFAADSTSASERPAPGGG